MTDLPVAADHDYPQMIAETNHVEPAPRRVRATLGGEQIFDTTRARYVWEWPYYPQYYIPADDIDPRFLVDEHHEQRLGQGTARRHGLRAGGLDRPGTVRVFGDDAINGVAGTARFDWDALDAWYEEDEQVFVHPRNPYVRVDALRSHRRVRASLEGVTLAETTTPVLVFETGLPTRYYFDRTDVAFAHLVPARTRASPAATGRCAPVIRCATATRISPGPMTTRPASCCPSPAWSPSTTRRSTSTSTVFGYHSPEPTSSSEYHDRGAAITHVAVAHQICPRPRPGAGAASAAQLRRGTRPGRRAGGLVRR
jgi:uncharacterized protein (DUF427 family)